METIQKIKKSNTYVCFNLSKTLFNNISTLLGLLSLFGIIHVGYNNEPSSITINNTTNYNLANSSVVSTDNTNLYYGYFMILPLFFGFIRVLNDFINLCKYGPDVPNDAAKGDYIGIFGEDLGLVCVETMKKSSNSPFDLLSFISSIYSLSNYAFTGLKIMLLIVFAGLRSPSDNQRGDCCIIKFLIFVGLSGFYVVYRYFTITIGENSAGDMLAFYILYQLISLFHTYIFLSMLR